MSNASEYTSIYPIKENKEGGNDDDEYISFIDEELDEKEGEW